MTALQQPRQQTPLCFNEQPLFQGPERTYASLVSTAPLLAAALQQRLSWMHAAVCLNINVQLATPDSQPNHQRINVWGGMVTQA